VQLRAFTFSIARNWKPGLATLYLAPPDSVVVVSPDKIQIRALARAAPHDELTKKIKPSKN
jgi:hypothetical protein